MGKGGQAFSLVFPCGQTSLNPNLTICKRRAHTRTQCYYNYSREERCPGMPTMIRWQRRPEKGKEQKKFNKNK